MIILDMHRFKMEFSWKYFAIIILLISAFVLIQSIEPALSQLNYQKIRKYKTNDKARNYLLRSISPAFAKREPIPVPQFGETEIKYLITNPESTEGEFSTSMRNWTYQPEKGDYYNIVADSMLANGIKPEQLKMYRLAFSPIKYWISTTNTSFANQIKMAMKDIDFYFPAESVDSPDEASLRFEVTQDDSSMKDCPKINRDTLACGTLEVKGNLPVGVVYLQASVFKSGNPKGVILHEVGHALGIVGHSDNLADLMAPDGGLTITSQNNSPENGSTAATNFTPRDLNTLYRIYLANY